MGDGATVKLECPPVLQFEEEVTPLLVDEKGRVAGDEYHWNSEIAAMPKLRIIPITTTQMTIRWSFLFCMMF
jgi:hypothetical protein